MKLQILGPGCAKCRTLTTATEQAVQALGLPYEIEKVTDLNRIMALGGDADAHAGCGRQGESERQGAGRGRTESHSSSR